MIEIISPNFGTLQITSSKKNYPVQAKPRRS